MKRLTSTLTIFLFLGGFAATATAADEVTGKGVSALDESPLNFSFSVLPVPSSEGDTAGELSTSGLRVRTDLSTGALSGGVTYFKGETGLDNGVDWYNAYGTGFGPSFTPVFSFSDSFFDPNTTLKESGAEESLKRLEGVALHAGFAVNSNLELTGIFCISKAEKEALDEDLNLYTATSYDWKIDLGGAYKLKDNMTYSFNFGYVNSGEQPGDSLSQTATSLQQGSVYILNQKLNMSF